MSYQCPVCEKLFSRPQDRTSHTRLKKDAPHQQYLRQQQQNVVDQFSATMQAATSAAVSDVTRFHLPEEPYIHSNDVDQGDLPSSRSMVIDVDSDNSDDEQGIISEQEVLVEDYNTDSDTQEGPLAAAVLALGDLDVDDLPEAFDFLPDLDLNMAEGEAGPGPSTAENRRFRRALVDDDDERSYRWHPTAGQVYRHEPTIHARWKSLFVTGTAAGQDYAPFNSRVDWEMAQWAVKEKISQKSFNRLMNIPQVIHSFFLSQFPKQ